MRGHAFIAEMGMGSFEAYATAFALEHMQPLTPAAQERIRTRNHPDFICVRPDGNAVKIGQVREIISEVAKRPYEGGKRVVAIFSADGMTPQAQNALLKSLEEPSAPNIFLLLCESSARLLPTILSRAVKLRAQQDDLGAAAREMGVDAQTAGIIAAIASDAAQARQLAADAAEQTGSWMVRRTALGQIARLQNGQPASELAEALPDDRREFVLAAGMMQSYYSDAMRVAAGNGRIENKDYRDALAFWQGRSARDAAQCADTCRQAVGMAGSNVSVKICASWLMIQLQNGQTGGF